MNTQKENPHRVDTLRQKHKALLPMDRGLLIEWYDVAMKFAPRVMACDLVLFTWLKTQMAFGQVDVSVIRNLCQTERIHRELSA
jgi:hypothetical protein